MSRPRERIEARRHQLLDRQFAFAGDDDVGARGEIFFRIVRRLGSAQHHAPSGGPRRAMMSSTLPRVIRLP